MNIPSKMSAGSTNRKPDRSYLRTNLLMERRMEAFLSSWARPLRVTCLHENGNFGDMRPQSQLTGTLLTTQNPVPSSFSVIQCFLRSDLASIHPLRLPGERLCQLGPERAGWNRRWTYRKAPSHSTCLFLAISPKVCGDSTLNMGCSSTSGRLGRQLLARSARFGAVSLSRIEQNPMPVQGTLYRPKSPHTGS